MFTAAWGWSPTGVTAQGGVVAQFDADWINTTGQNVQLWGIQADLYTGLAIPPGNCMDATGGAGASFTHYLKSIADMGLTVKRKSDGCLIFIKGSDHYDNSPTLNGPPIFFPYAFLIVPGDGLHLNAHAGNGYQREYGGSFVFNSSALAYFTCG